jgi:hypothetical protein
MNKHDTDLVSLGFGSVFLGLVTIWLLAQLVRIDLPSGGWFVAGGLILLGALGLTATARLTRR